MGSLIGGNYPVGSTTAAENSGIVFGGSIGTVQIGKNVQGGSGLDSGEIFSTGNITKAVVMGDIHGGSAGLAAFAGTPAQGNTPAQPATGAVAGDSGVIKSQTAGSIVVMGSLIGGTPGTSRLTPMARWRSPRTPAARSWSTRRKRLP